MINKLEIPTLTVGYGTSNPIIQKSENMIAHQEGRLTTDGPIPFNITPKTGHFSPDGGYKLNSK